MPLPVVPSTLVKLGHQCLTFHHHEKICIQGAHPDFLNLTLRCKIWAIRNQTQTIPLISGLLLNKWSHIICTQPAESCRHTHTNKVCAPISAGFTVSSGRAVQQKDGQMAERSRGLKGRKATCVSVCQHIDISSGPHCPSSCLTRVSGEWMAGLFSLQKMSFGSAGWHREWGTHWSYLLVSKFIFNMNPDCFSII